MTSLERSRDWQRRRLVARFWCDRMRDPLKQGKAVKPIEVPRQLSLPGIYVPKEKP